MAFEPAFADTSFFFALAAKRDRTHEPAVKAFTRLLRLQRPLVTTDYVLDETLTLTKARTSAKVALALLDRIESSPALSIQHITHDRFAAAKAFFRKHADHGYSFTDCTSFISPCKATLPCGWSPCGRIISPPSPASAERISVARSCVGAAK